MGVMEMKEAEEGSFGNSQHVEDERCFFSIKDVGEFELEQVRVSICDQSGSLQCGSATYFVEDGL